MINFILFPLKISILVNVDKFTITLFDQRPFVDCCSVQNYGYVDNAFLSCQTSDTCEAQCYRGYIFPTGKTKTNYSCQQDRLGIAPSCKRISTLIIVESVMQCFLFL